MEFNFLDAPPGSGKTTAIINEINKTLVYPEYNKRFLVVTPYLTEVERICTNTPCIEPVGKKREEIKGLLSNGENVCCTHALFNLFDNEILNVIREGDYQYTLFIDEDITLMSNIVGGHTLYNKGYDGLIEVFGTKDIDLAIDCGLLIEDKDTHQLTWNNRHTYNNNDSNKGIYDRLKNRLLLFDLYKCCSGVVQVLKKEVWQVFSSVTFCSYRMRYSLLHAYCELMGIKAIYKHLEGDTISNGYLDLKPPQDCLRRIKTFTTKNNSIIAYSTFSKTWYMNNIRKEKTKYGKALIAAWRSFKENDVPKDTGKKRYFWTCYKGFENSLRDSKSLSERKWVPCNLKATNDYSEYQIVGYFINRFTNVNLKAFLKAKGIELDEEELALSEFIQFLWRSNIRVKDSKTNIYVFIAAHALFNDFNKWREP